MKILLVDDDQGTLVTMRIALSGKGFKVQAVDDGLKAIEIMGKEDFDWLITDAHMTPIHGFALAKEALQIQPAIKTVMISGVCDDTDIKGWPIRSLFSKPVDIDKLILFLGGP